MKSAINKKHNELRPAQLLAARFKMSNENIEIKQAMAQSRREKRGHMIERQLETSQCSLRYYK